MPRRHKPCTTAVTVKSQLIQVTGPTVFLLAGYRITVEPLVPEVRPPLVDSPMAGRTKEAAASDWLEAEAQLQRETNMPFEPTSVARGGRLQFAPRAGGKFRAPTGAEVEIARVVGRDGALWLVTDASGRPAVLKRVECQWHALPRDYTAPAPGDVIVHNGIKSHISAVLGEAEVGGWAVANGGEVPLHVFRGEGNHWISLGVVEVE